MLNTYIEFPPDNPPKIVLDGICVSDSLRVLINAIDIVLAKKPKTKELTLDLSGLRYMDSLTLGMLLMLRDAATSKGVSLILLNPRDSVFEVLTIASFSKLFVISASVT
jgi:HptB-dependent secretion and biofilm anti anti-sigma factor